MKVTLILILTFVTLTSAGTYKGTLSSKVGKKTYKCSISIGYTVSPPKCGKSTAKCKPALKKSTKFEAQTDDATLSFYVAKNKISKCTVAGASIPTTSAPTAPPTTSAPGTSCLQDNTRLYGTDYLGSSFKTTTALECLVKCAQTVNCVAINWIKHNTQCDFHKSYDGSKPETNSDSVFGDAACLGAGSGTGSNLGFGSGSNSGSGSGSSIGPGSGLNSTCIYNNRVYELGGKINIVEKCSTLICSEGKLGPQWNIKLLGHSCCQYNGQLLEEGHQVSLYNGQTAKCCQGQMVVAIKSSGTNTDISNTQFSENGQFFTQENMYNSSNGVLTLLVPAHKDYSQSTFVLHPEMKQEILSSNGTCLLSDLLKSINVYNMADEIKKNDKDKIYEEDYKIKIRKSLLRHQDRMNLNTESRNLCKDKVVRKTIDKSLSKEQFDGLMNKGEDGESSVVIISNLIDAEKKCRLEDACTNPGPNACGYGFPNPAGGGFTAHQLSATVICVQCCLDNKIIDSLPVQMRAFPPDQGQQSTCCKDNYPEHCSCKDIKNKIDLMDCILGNKTHYHEYEDLSGTIVSQSMTFNAFNPHENARALKLHVPAHDNYQELTTIIHAAQNGYWHHSSLENNMLMKIGDTCHILDLPTDVFPMDLAVNFLEQGSEYVKTEDQRIQTSLLNNIGNVQYETLHPDIQNICKGHKIVKSERVFQDIPINQHFQLNITKNHLSSQQTSCCALETATTYYTGCIKWPNPSGGPEIGVHEIVSAGVSLTCCMDASAANPGCDPSFPGCCGCHCTCSEITNKHDFSECLGRPTIPLRGRLTQSGSLTDIEQHNLLSSMKSMKADTSNHGFTVVSSYHGSYCPHQNSVYEPKFLPWHRLYTVNYDTGLRRYKHAARFPYWDWTTPMTALPDLVNSPTILDPLDPTTPITNPFHHTSRFPSSSLWNGGIDPNTGDSLLDQVMHALDQGDLATFTAQIKIPHDWIHVWVGGGGSMSSTSTASLDPIFYLNHHMVDLILAVYQKLNPNVVPWIPTPSQMSIQLNPFFVGTLNSNQITLTNNNIEKTLNYEGDLCYTYGLDISSSNIVFGGKTLSQIDKELALMRKKAQFYVGFYLNSFYETSAIIKFNICHKRACYPGGQIPIFGGQNQPLYVDDVVSKIDVTNLLSKYDITIKHLHQFPHTVKFEVTEVIAINGTKLPTDKVYQPVTIGRPASNMEERGKKDAYGIYFGQGVNSPPQISISHGTYFSIIFSENSIIYKANDKEALEKCDHGRSSVVSSNPNDYYTYYQILELGYHYYFDAEQECQPKSKMKVFVYSSGPNIGISEARVGELGGAEDYE